MPSYFEKRPYLKLSNDDRTRVKCSKNGQRVLMSAGSSRDLVTYYYCPVCRASKKVVRPAVVEVGLKLPPRLVPLKKSLKMRALGPVYG